MRVNRAYHGRDSKYRGNKKTEETPRHKDSKNKWIEEHGRAARGEAGSDEPPPQEKTRSREICG